jgi:hypothetical protein
MLQVANPEFPERTKLRDKYYLYLSFTQLTDYQMKLKKRFRNSSSFRWSVLKWAEPEVLSR